MKKILLTNLAYGDRYTNTFLNYHIRSLLDETNIPAFKDRIRYAFFTDPETLPIIQRHPLVKMLADQIDVEWNILEFPKDCNRHEMRYAALIQMFKLSVQKALDIGYMVSPMVCDLFVAKDYLKKVFQRIDEGHESIFVLPMRTAFESIEPHIRNGTLHAEELCYLGYNNLHPLWVACHWYSPQFSKIPFTLLWNSGTGLLARSFSITPIVFDPTKEMLDTNHVIDVEIPSMCKNPYWATDWVECPIMGIEFLSCYYPPFSNESSKIANVGNWAKCLHRSQYEFLSKPLYYPSRERVDPDGYWERMSLPVAEGIQEFK